MGKAYKRANDMFKIWVFSLHIKSAIENDKISYDSFMPDLRFGEHDSFNDIGDIKTWAYNLSSIAKGACFVAFDEALDSIYGRKQNFSKTDPGTNQLWKRAFVVHWATHI